jgi:hypothetical protein
VTKKEKGLSRREFLSTPDAVKIKEILLSREIGEVTSVDFNYYLDVYHGASYFRRMLTGNCASTALTGWSGAARRSIEQERPFTIEELVKI